MKKKLTITIASILSVIVIIGVGFAAWVITNPNVKGEANGTISVETVTDKSYTLTATISGEAISFGAPATMDTTNAWLTNNSGNPENLTATLTLTLKYMKLDDVGTITLKMETLKDSASDNTFESLVNGKYIVNPTISYKAKDTDTYTDIKSDNIFVGGLEIPKDAFNETKKPAQSEQGEATATIKITFGWGTKFGSENPYNYYNKQDYSTKLAKEANDNLTALYNALNGVSYKVTVTGTTAA